MKFSIPVERLLSHSHDDRGMDVAASALPRDALCSPAELKPGEVAPATGRYRLIGPRGGKGRAISVAKGDCLPPTNNSGAFYQLLQQAKRKPGN